MRWKSCKGEVAVAIAIATSIAAFLVGACWKPLTNFIGLGGNPQKTMQKSSVIRESKPYYVTGDDGKMHLIEATKTVTNTVDTNEEQKLTIWQKLMNVGRIYIVLMIVGVFFPPVALVMQMFNKKAKELASAAYDKLAQSKDELKSETATIVQSVDVALKTFDSSIQSAQSAAAVSTDPQVKATYNAIVLALTETQKQFLIAMSRKQDSSTKALVSSLKNSGA